MENVCFGKEIKSLNILKNPNYIFKVYNEDVLFLTEENKKELRDSVNTIISAHGDAMGKNIRYLTSKLVEARENSEDKLISVMPPRQSRSPASGIFIYKQYGCTFTCFYHTDYTSCKIDPKTNKILDGSARVELIQFIDDELSLLQSTAIANDDDEIIIFDTITQFLPNELTHGRNVAMDSLDVCLEFDFLLEHIEIEEKQLFGKSKVNGFGTAYSNLTTNNIKIIDSRWFTNLIKSDAFKVRGHFRFQPCGPGLSSKKLIWINEFEKLGYTSKAYKTA